jgi:TatD DNase family protein
MFTDTHTHLFVEQFKDDLPEVIEKALNTGVKKMFLPNIDLDSISFLQKTASHYKECCFPMMGLHPTSIEGSPEKVLDEMEILLKTGEYAGVGETGTDAYWDKTWLKEQEQSFIRHIHWGEKYDLPVIIHSRETLERNIEIIETHSKKPQSGIFHCFNGTIEQSERIIDLGYYMGIGGVVTFKNSGMAEIIREIPLEYMVLETDSPWLAPHPHRGKRNESSFIPIIAQKVADIKGLKIEEIEHITTENAKKIFGEKFFS